MSQPEEKIVAFIDILGFKELSYKYISDQAFLTKLDKNLGVAQTILTSKNSITKGASIKMFSDCICISAPVYDSNIPLFIYTLETLQLNLAIEGIFIRGAISFGQHFETSRMILSIPLIEAYEIETKVAKFPRIIISRKLLQFINEKERENPELWPSFSLSKESIEYHIIRDNIDGEYFLNYLDDAFSPYSYTTKEYLIRTHKTSVKNWIKNGLATKLTESKLAKYRWLVRYHNSMFSGDPDWEIPHSFIAELDNYKI